MQLHLDLIQDQKGLIALSSELKKHSIIAVDTEFIREKTFIPELALIQVATREDTWLIDTLSFNNDQINPLIDILTDSKILKILHSAFGDQECFYSAYGVTATPTFDTFEAASLLGFGESVGLRDLIKKTTGVKIPKFLTRTDWLRRPISEEMKRYAMADVEHLVEISEKLIEKLKTKNRYDWALQISQSFENPKLYQNNFEEIAKRLGKSGRLSTQTYPILLKLVAWREDRARKLNIPRRRVANDDTLINIANARPHSIAQLEKFRGLNPGEVRKQGERLLKIISQEYSKKNNNLPTPPDIIKPSSDQARIIDFLATYLKSLCRNLEIASRLILTSKDLNKIVVENLLDSEQWIEAGICSRQAAELVGEELKDVLNGKKALAIQEGKLKVLNL